jgi:hypothetical protein
LDTAAQIHVSYKPEIVNYQFFEPNTSCEIQPMDLSVNHIFKEKIRVKEKWYLENYNLSKSGYFEKIDRQSFINIVS